MSELLTGRRELLQGCVLTKLDEPIRESPELDASLPDLVSSVKAQRLEGLVAKRRDSRYESGQRSGAWQKMRVSMGQAFVIARYTPAAKSFDAVVFGYYDGGRLIYTQDGPGTDSRLRPANSSSGALERWRRRTALLPTSPKPEADAGARG